MGEDKGGPSLPPKKPQVITVQYDFLMLSTRRSRRKTSRPMPIVRLASITRQCSDHCLGGCTPECKTHWSCCHCGSKSYISVSTSIKIPSKGSLCLVCSRVTHHCPKFHHNDFCDRCQTISKTFAHGEEFQCHYCHPELTPYPTLEQD